MFFFSPLGGMYREFEAIKAIGQPHDLSLYRSLLPDCFDMPDQPAVFYFAADYQKVVSWPFKYHPWSMSRYLETSVLIRCVYQGEDGWHSLTMPFTTWISKHLGREYLGFPKYVADEIRLQSSGETWSNWTKHEGIQKMHMEYSPGLNRDLKAWEKEMLGPEFFFDAPSFQLLPADAGPGLMKVWIEPKKEPKWSNRLGMVKVTVDPEDAWSGLIPVGEALPGLFIHFTEGGNLAFQRMA
jgi:hypothetical protein